MRDPKGAPPSGKEKGAPLLLEKRDISSRRPSRARKGDWSGRGLWNQGLAFYSSCGDPQQGHVFRGSVPQASMARWVGGRRLEWDAGTEAEITHPTWPFPDTPQRGPVKGQDWA